MFVNTNTIIIHWRQWGGKTLFATLLSLDFLGRIYSNYHIYKNDNPIICFLDKLEFLDLLEYSSQPWCIIFDEVWLNFNSKEWASNRNKTLTKFFFLVRKFNLSSIYISQRFSSIPVDMRELVNYIYEVSIIPRKKKHPLFRITRQTTNNEGFLEFQEEFIFDIIKYLQKAWISYNTLESSIIH